MPRNSSNGRGKKTEANQDLKKKSNGASANVKSQSDTIAESELSDRDMAEARKEILEVIHKDAMPANQKQGQPQKTAKPAPPVKASPPPPPKVQAPPPVKKIVPPVAPKPTPPPEPPPPSIKPSEAEIKEPKKKKSTSLKKKVVLFVVAGLLGIVVVALVVFGVGLYRYKWNNRVMTEVMKIVPYPAAIVKYHLVRYSDFNHDLAALKQYYDKQASLTPDLVTKPSEEDFRSLIIDKLIKDKLLEIEAKTLGITATQADINTEVDKLSTESGGRDALEATLQEMYGWKLADFERSILKSYVLRQKVQEKLAFDASLSYNQNAKKRIDEVAQKLKDGSKFEDLVKEYNEDTSSGETGDLGWVARSDLDEKFATAAFALNEGEVSSIVQTVYGYHIIKLVEKPKADDTANNGTEGEERYHLQHILVYTMGVDQWLTEKETAAKIYNYIK
ncbi:MAG: peptidylprolyl isomerase [Patescibacteria group bacterium]